MPLAARIVLWLPLALGLFALPACAATTESTQQEASIQALTRAQSAVVGVEVQAIEGARSAETLGRERSGSGVVIGRDGLILTIGYLMLEADSIQVTTQDGRSLPARAVAYDQATGFGLVRPLLPLRGITPVPLGSLADVRPGDALLAATGGEEADLAMTQVVDKRSFSGYWEYFIESALFTSPPIANHSGAAVFNRRGELLGIGSLFVIDATGQGEELPGNMYVPVDLLKPILAELQQSGSSRQSHRPWLGLTSAERDGRVQVMRVSRGSPAEQVGIKPSDVVLAVEGVRVATLEEFYKTLWAHGRPETEITLTVLQGADVRNIRVKPVDRMLTMAKPPGI